MFVLRPAVRQFVERRIVDDIPKFHQVIESVLRLRNSVVIEVALLIVVYTGDMVWRSKIALGAASWYAIPDGTQMHLTAAGILVRLCQRADLPVHPAALVLPLLSLVLVSVSNLAAETEPDSHPYRQDGWTGFLGVSTYAFAPIIVAQGAVLARVDSQSDFLCGAEPGGLQSTDRSFPGFLHCRHADSADCLRTAACTSPTRWSRRLAGSRAGMADASREVVSRRSVGDEELLGTGDIQSLADLANSFSVVQEMRLVPFGWRDVTRLAAIAAVPFLPLLLTVFSLDEVAGYIIQAVF